MRVLRFFVTLFQFQRTNWRAVLLCFLVASLFWVFNALSKSYSANISFPLQLSFDSSRFAPAAELPDRLTMNVSGKGWELLRKQMAVRMPVITVPVERPAETRGLATGGLMPVLASQVGGLTINFPVTDSIRFQIEPRERQRLKVVVMQQQVSFRGNLGRVSPIVALPDSVEVEGPLSLVRSLSDSVLVVLPADRVAENYREQVEVVLPGVPFVASRPTVVEVMFEVAEMRDISLRVPVRSAQNPLQFDSVACQLWVPARWLNMLQDVTVGFHAELPPDATAGRVLPRLRGLPDVVTVIRVDSVSLAPTRK